MTNPNEQEWWRPKVDETFQKPDGEYVPRDRSLEQLASCHDGTNEVWEAVDDAREQSRINDHFNRITIHEAVHDMTRKIVAEAERRTWEEAIQIVRLKDWGEHTRHDACNEIIKALDAKLVSLLDSSKE